MTETNTIAEIDTAADAATSLSASKRFAAVNAIEILALILLTVSVRLPWVLMIPISQAPDEGAHFWVIDFLHSNLRLPTLSDMMKSPSSAYYGALSPLSYLPHVLSAFFLPFLNAPLAYRFGSLLMGVVSVLGARAIGKELFPDSRVAALATPLFLVFHVQLAFVNGYSNNDSTSMAVATWALYAALVMVRRGLTSSAAVLIGVFCGLLALSKPTTYCLFPVILVALLMTACLHRQTAGAFAKKVLTIAGIALCIALPFFLRNWLVFKGDLIGMRTMLDMWWASYGKPAQLYRFPVIDNADWRYCAFHSYVGNLGNMDKLLPSRIYKLFSLSIVLSSIGWLFSWIRSWLARAAIASRSERAVRICLWSLVALTFLMNFTALIAGSASLNSTGPPQGRYLFPSEAAIAALIVGGLSRIGRIAVLLFLVLNVVSTVIGLTMLYPVYHFDVNIFR